MGKTVDKLKALGSRAMLVWGLATLALTSPSFARATAHVVCVPDLVRVFPVLLAALAALYALFASRLPRCRGALAAAASVACLFFEVSCAYLQRAYAGWNYLSMGEGLTLVERGLRLVVFCALVLWASGGEGRPAAAPRRAVACLVASGALAALAISFLAGHVSEPETTLALGAAGWAYLAALVVLAEVRGLAAGISFASGAFAFLGGALLGNDVATILADSVAVDIPWALASSAVLAAVSFVPVALPWARGAGEAVAAGCAESGEEGGASRAASALGAVPGASELSEREAQVAEAELCGKSDADIAAGLGLKPQTVATYRARVYQKLGVESRAGFVEAARSSSGLEGMPARGGGQAAALPLPVLRRSAVLRAALGTAALLLLAMLLRRAAPLPAQRLVLLAVSALLFVKGAAELARARGQGARACAGGARTGFEPQVVAGCVCACFGIVASTQFPMAPGWRALAAPAAAFLCLTWVFCAARDDMTRALTALTCGVVGLLTVQAGARGFQAASLWTQLVVPLVGLLAVAALFVDKRLAEGEFSDALLVGEARCDAYLRGRGLSELEARVLILSAKRMSRPAIAESLAISVATVSAYRARGVKKLGAEDLDAAVRLMRAEGGLE